LTQNSEKAELHSVQILIAEDDAIVQMIVKKVLEPEGYTLEFVDDGLAVISALEARPFDLILMDCLMPGRDGFETTRMIRSEESGRFHPGIPVVAMTGLTEKADKLRCLEAGMDRVVTKPLDPQTLLSTIKKCLFRSEHLLEEGGKSHPDPQPSWDEGFRDSVIDEFLRGLPVVIKELQQAMNNDDLPGLRNISHRFRGVVDILQASRLSTCSKALESAARDGAKRLSFQLTTQLIDELETLHAMLTE